MGTEEEEEEKEVPCIITIAITYISYINTKNHYMNNIHVTKLDNDSLCVMLHNGE
jgi:hypothetical protein